MSDSVINKKDSVPILQTIIIIILVAAVAAMGYFTVRKYTAKQPVISPQEAQVNTLTDMVNKNPSDIDSRQRLAFAYQMLQQYDLAKEQYREVLKILPDDLASLYNLGVIAEAEKKYPEAIQYLNKVLSLKKNHLLAAIALGEIYMNQGQYDKVIDVTNRALKELPDQVDLHDLKGLALEKTGKTVEAKNEYREALKYVPDDTEATEGLARLK